METELVRLDVDDGRPGMWRPVCWRACQRRGLLAHPGPGTGLPGPTEHPRDEPDGSPVTPGMMTTRQDADPRPPTRQRPQPWHACHLAMPPHRHGHPGRL